MALANPEAPQEPVLKLAKLLIKLLQSANGRITLLLILAANCLAVNSLAHARKPRMLNLRGSLLTAASIPRNLIEVDADLRFQKIRLKIKPSGQQFIALPAEAAQDVWSPKLDGPADYALDWQGDGRFRLRLGVNSRSAPTHCRLTFRFPGGGERCTASFKLSASGPDRFYLAGFASSLTVEQLPAPMPTLPNPTAPSAQTDSQVSEPPDYDMKESGAPYVEDTDIRTRAESALQGINRISQRELRARYLLIHYLESKPNQQAADPTQRTKKIGIMLYGILQRKLHLQQVLTSGNGSFVQSGADMAELSVEEASLSEN